MAEGKYEHIRDITLDRKGTVIRIILESGSKHLPDAADQLSKDLAASLSTYRRRLVPFPRQIRVQWDDLTNQSNRDTVDPALDKTNESTLMEKVNPRFGLDDYICEPGFRQVLDDVLFYAKHYPEIRSQMGVTSVNRSFLVNFFGESGTGKTMVAEAFANDLGKELYVMNFANVESSLVGRTPKNIARAFRKIDPGSAIIMLDEADAFVSRRIADLKQGAEYALNAARGQIINEIDRFNGMIILATNLFGTYDHAILRRIKFNLAFELPSKIAIKSMFNNFLSNSSGLPVIDFAYLAEESAGLSGGDIYNLSEIIVMKSLQAAKLEKQAFDSGEVHGILQHYKQKNRRSGTVRLDSTDA